MTNLGRDYYKAMNAELDRRGMPRNKWFSIEGHHIKKGVRIDYEKYRVICEYRTTTLVVERGSGCTYRNLQKQRKPGASASPCPVSVRKSIMSARQRKRNRMRRLLESVVPEEVQRARLWMSKHQVVS
ncbi:MAG: hypothetical protein KAJ19_11395 [Gammaproteobacteria bacterium]|nr:hypothetical protein [Gammaproteobacteria bacterium]